MNNESDKSKQVEAIGDEFDALLAFSISEHRREMIKIGEWFEAEFEKILKEIEHPTGQPVYDAKELRLNGKNGCLDFADYVIFK